jgi:hypothetical protein
MKLKEPPPDPVLLAMAYSRQEFKSRVEEKVGGALLEFYKAECAAANRLTRWVQHWRSETSRLLDELQVVLLHEIRGFRNRRKAFVEVLEYLDRKDPAYRRAAESAVVRDFKLKKLRQGVPSEAAERFLGMVWESAESVLE